MDESKSEQQTQLVSNKTRTGISIYRNLSRSWNFKSNNYTKNNGIRQRYNYYKYLLPIITLLFASPSYAETVGGVSATAAPVANSSGSVTNQAIQVLQGPYITNTYGGGIQCQGPTLNFTPYVTGAVSAQKPFEDFYNDPVYDLRDLDEDGSLDNPGDILYRVPIRTGQKDNYSLSLGFSATWSKPLDTKLQEQCKQAAATQIELQQQLIANKRLDFEIARLKNCGELKKQGIYFHPKSPYYSVCADIIVTNPGGVIPQHRHSIPTPVSKKAEDLGGVISTTP
ncbi:hypothetical protein SWZG_00069 [Synechococcus phage S-SKS1]|jgi:hypothetical protein|uniref:Uncharacterized protein n=1 Tax=Synechococcus phage S-SKS1 TaxID=754042 RepID=M4R1I4_9CAUD|nr:hypothetical protein SWZG_00069 [Synechococcus phage S-SKS1]AGH31582.1 hypothetical protein SWZG_00069 [Synechococcus phage S-SKS1]